MKVVFEASTSLDAHMISNLLDQQGIVAQINGEYLQGGVGDLQALNFIKVLVNEEDYLKAIGIIEEWELQQVATEIETNIKSKTNHAILLFFIGLIIGIGATFLAYNSPVTKDGIDYNSDGKLDETWTYKNYRIHKSEVDRNLDGKIDQVHYFDRKGIIKTTKSDDDFDGVYESEFKYRAGQPYHQITDIDQNGIIDHHSYFKYGILNKIVIMGDGNDSPKKLQQYKMGKLIFAKYDSNGNGEYDINIEYDYFEEAK